MSWGIITDQWRLKLLAVGLAVVMLGAVAFSQNPPTTLSISVPLRWSLAQRLVILNPPSRITVTYTGLADVIKNVTADNITAVAEAGAAHPGSGVQLNVTAKPTDSRVAVQTPQPIVVNIDTLTVKELPVQVSAHAAPGWALAPGKTLATCPGAANPSPCKVHFDGPTSWEGNISATASLSAPVSAGTIDSPNQPVLITNSTGTIDLSSCRTFPCPSLDVNSVNIHVEAEPGASSSTVPLVDQPPTHGPPSGYHVTGVTISPITVLITGDPSAIGRTQRIFLPAVDLSGRTTDAVFPLPIPYPDGTSGTVATATVTYSISPNPAVSASP
jgi:YbbR domain-containing protein